MSPERPTLPTRAGHAEWGDNRFRGQSVAHDLSGCESITGLLVLAVVGRRINENERVMLDDLATVMTVADPRIWPLKLVRVASAYGGSLAAMAAATVNLQGAQVGHQMVGRAAEMLSDLRDALSATTNQPTHEDDLALEHQCSRLLAKQGRLFGLGVPFRVRDERVDMVTERVVARGRSELVHWRLFERAAETFWRIKRVRPNVGLAAAAIFLDMGFTPAQAGPLMTAIGACAFWVNAVEGAQQMPECLRQLPDSCVRYVGPPSRVSPRAAEKR